MPSPGLAVHSPGMSNRSLAVVAALALVGCSTEPEDAVDSSNLGGDPMPGPGGGERRRVACSGGQATLPLAIDPQLPPDVDAIYCRTSPDFQCVPMDGQLRYYDDRVGVNCTGVDLGYDHVHFFIRS